jgi:hypothetical protein
MELFKLPELIETRWVSFENPTGANGAGGKENAGSKGHPFDSILAGEVKTLLDISGNGSIRRIWMTVNDRSPEMLRSLKLEIFWDHSELPAVSAPLGDFFGASMGRMADFENALFSNPEGRSFNCCVPMPFRKHARVTLSNESSVPLGLIFYDIDLLLGENHPADTLYFHSMWREESPNFLGKDFDILPRVEGSGRFLGCCAGIIADPRYAGSWWGEGEVKAWFGDDEWPTLCGTGTEDYIGTGWGQGRYSHRTQGCHVADSEAGQWSFYRFHLDDPVYFRGGCRVAIQTIGGASKEKVISILGAGVPLIPVTIDPAVPGGFTHLMTLPQPVDLRSSELPDGWCNFWRQDHWSVVSYFYLDSPQGQF